MKKPSKLTSRPPPDVWADKDPLALKRTFGVGDANFANALLSQLVRLNQGKEGVDIQQLMFALTSIKALEPRDATEAMLISQMIAVHHAIFDLSVTLASAQTLVQLDSASRALGNLTRVAVLQFEAFKRARSDTRPVTVGSVTVNDGGNAIVGNVEPRLAGSK